jgi:hypothetical protein
MKGLKNQAALWLVSAVALTCGAFAAPDTSRFYVTSAASSLVQQGLAAPVPIDAETAAFQQVAQPGIRFVPNEAQATTAPWIDSNGSRFQRGLQKANYAKLPAGSAPLAAAEAFAFNVDAILNPVPSDVEELGRMLRFLKTHEQPPRPVLANIGVIDDGSPVLGEVLNLLTRRNLLYRVVSAPDRTLDLTVQLGTEDFPKESAATPSEFAARVRAKLGDDKRLVRLYGTSTVIARLTGDGKQARLYLLSYGGRRGGGGQAGGGQQAQQGGAQRGQSAQQVQGIRVRVLGWYRPAKFAAYGAAPDATLLDVENQRNATEFSVPSFMTFAIIDLKAAK